jgi:hypothetical protein
MIKGQRSKAIRSLDLMKESLLVRSVVDQYLRHASGETLMILLGCVIASMFQK